MIDTKRTLERELERLRPPRIAFEQLEHRRDRKRRNQRVAAGVLGIAVFAIASIGLVRLLGSERTPAAGPDTFEGMWVSTTDAVEGSQRMTISVSPEGAAEIVMHDDIATACAGTPSTLTGTGRIEGGTQLVIPAPVYTCDDGSEPEPASGPPVQEQLRDYTLVLDQQTDTLSDGFGGVWVRRKEIPSPGTKTSGVMWPQSSPDEISEAQERADAGDPAYTWQVDPRLVGDADPHEAVIFERFIREELGWEAFVPFGGFGYLEEGGLYDGVEFLRCAPGRTNPLSDVYPDMPREVLGCAPTIDDTRWETVRFTLEQPARTGPSGIWVVSYWELLPPGEPYSGFDHLYPDFDQRQVEQEAPPSDSEVTALLRAFLDARVDGAGAETYLHPHDEDGPSPDEEVPLLYATSRGVPYERFEIERVQGPVWPTGWFEYELRLFGEDGTVVEQTFVVVGQDGRLGLMYGVPDGDPPIPTTENGQAVPVPYSLLDGEVTFAAAPPWSTTSQGRTSTTLGGMGRGSAVQFTMLTVMADPRTGVGCETGPPATDADALVRGVRSNPDLEATAPVAASVGGLDAVWMDVVAPRRLEVGDCAPMVLEHLSMGPDSPARLYLLDLPDGMSARVLAVAITTHESIFDDVVEAATPVVDSIEFHTR